MELLNFTLRGDGCMMQESNPISEPEFTTHKKYIQFMSEISDNVKLLINQKFNSPSIDTDGTYKKLKIIELTKDSLFTELQQIQREPEYVKSCLMWFPIKSYYIIFNLLLVLESLILNDNQQLQNGHKQTFILFKKLLKHGDIEFSENCLKQIYTYQDTLSWKIPKSENLKLTNINFDFVNKALIKKLFEYSRIDYKRTNKIVKFTKITNNEFNAQITMSLIEFFYWYRLQFNYWNMNCINLNITLSDLRSFCVCYYKVTDNFYKILSTAINSVSQKRLNKIIIK